MNATARVDNEMHGERRVLQAWDLSRPLQMGHTQGTYNVPLSRSSRRPILLVPMEGATACLRKRLGTMGNSPAQTCLSVCLCALPYHRFQVHKAIRGSLLGFLYTLPYISDQTGFCQLRRNFAKEEQHTAVVRIKHSLKEVLVIGPRVSPPSTQGLKGSNFQKVKM